MARARNIKPGFFTNDVLAEVEPLGRLLFAGLWCIADRKGRLEDRSKRIKAELLPYDECDVDNLLEQLRLNGFIVRYQIGDTRYIQVTNFEKHQNPHVNEKPSEIPEPPISEAVGEDSGTCTVLVPEQHSTNPADSLLMIPDSLNLIPDSLERSDKSLPDTSPTERLVLNELSTTANYPLSIADDLAYIRQLSIDFPTIDLLDEIKRWKAWLIDHPLKKKSNPRLQIRNWCQKAAEWQAERSDHRGRTGKSEEGPRKPGKYDDLVIS